MSCFSIRYFSNPIGMDFAILLIDKAILSDNFSDRSAETEKKRLAKPFYSKTILQIVSVSV
ncbi:MAG: hypothetical protein BWK80_00095 [Desulfobacteraceae bacterium IS3]|nr:MAG: hypothetical protein BWK80_00095 [Desulfobacteraceae bacterium IS3]